MSRPRKPARLWYDRKAETWCILDAGSKRRLGLGKGEDAAAERELEKHLLTKRSVEKPAKGRRADQIGCAEVLDRYLEKRGESVTRPKELAQRVDALLEYWGEMTLDEVDEDSCQDFAEEIGTDSYARRCLEDFRAAVNAYARAGYLRDQVRFTLPEKSQARTDWLSVEEAVALCRVAWRFRERQMRDTREGRRLIATSKRPTAHVVRFIAAAIGTCSRSARVFQASYVAEPGRPWIDLEAGLHYRMAPDEKERANKRAPTVPIGPRLLAAMKRWHTEGDRYLVEYAGRPADCKKAFAQVVERARVAYPHLFNRPDGTPKKIVRHALRHTGITWLALAGIDPYEVCKYAGITMDIFERVYSHHHPDFMAGVKRAQSRKVKPKLVADNTAAAA